MGLCMICPSFRLLNLFRGVRFYLGTRSPNEAERAKFGYSCAWMHHKGRNRHHFEYWTDYNPEIKMISPVKMPVKFVKEMLRLLNTWDLIIFISLDLHPRKF